MHKGFLVWAIMIIVIAILGYLITGYNFILHPLPASTTISPIATTATTTAPTTTIIYSASCNNFSILSALFNKTYTGTCMWGGGALGIWLANGNSNYTNFTIIGANNVTYLNQSINYGCIALFSNFSMPAQTYKITMHRGFAGGSCNNKYSIINLNTTLVPPKNAVYKNIYGGKFASGTYIGWNLTGKGFDSRPINASYADTHNCTAGGPWTGYNGTYFASTYNCGSSNAAGNLTSSPFYASEHFIDFQTISPENNLIYVEILENGIPEIIAHYNTFNESAFGASGSYTFRNVTIPIGTLIGKNLTLRVVADTSTSGEFVAVGDFRLSGQPLQSYGVVSNISILN